MSRISEVVGVSKATVQSIIKRIDEKETPLPARQPGAPKKLNERDLRHLQAITRKDKFSIKIMQLSISRTTLITYIKESGFESYFAAHKLALTEENKKRRLHWAKERVNWTKDQWDGVVWSDESRFTV
ncbi:hypothetical protein G6F56_007834 [Rhizopus delemar]|nr:hypothetical protein G6F56_007834 [Rhizopus delemar]